MKHLFIWSLVLSMSCVERIKGMFAEPEEEEKEDRRHEGDKPGDCYDGFDSDMSSLIVRILGAKISLCVRG